MKRIMPGIKVIAKGKIRALKRCDMITRYKDYKSEIWILNDGNMARFVWFDDLSEFILVDLNYGTKEFSTEWFSVQEKINACKFYPEDHRRFEDIMNEVYGVERHPMTEKLHDDDAKLVRLFFEIREKYPEIEITGYYDGMWLNCKNECDDITIFANGSVIKNSGTPHDEYIRRPGN